MNQVTTYSDLRLAFRLIRKQPLLTATAILALAVGIGMATTGFTFLEAVLYARLPFQGGERFVLVDVYAEPQALRAQMEDSRFMTLREGLPALSHLGAFRGTGANLLLPSGEAALVGTTFITPGSFAMLPFVPLIGRTLNSADARAGAPPVALLRESVWRRDFGADESIAGTTVNLGGVQRIIVGVMPDSFEFPNSPDVWMPIETVAGARIFGVLERQDAAPAATQQLMARSRQYESEFPGASKLRMEAVPFTEALSRGLDVLAAALVGILLLILLVIAANVANLVFARTLSRSTELAIRTAIGATRAVDWTDLYRSVDHGRNCSRCGACGVAGGASVGNDDADRHAILGHLRRQPTNDDLRRCRNVIVRGRGRHRSCAQDHTTRCCRALASANRSVPSGFGRAGSIMIAVQIALSIALLSAALLLARGVSNYMEGGPDLPAGEVVTAQLGIDETQARIARPNEIEDVLRRMPGVVDAGLATSLPRLSPPTVMTAVRSETGGEVSVPRAAPVVAVSQTFIQTLGGRAILGRLFEPGDFEDRGHPVAIVNEPFVTKFFGGANPIGRQVRIVPADSAQESGPWRDIVGVVPDLGLSAGDETLAAGIYVPMKDERFFYAAVRAAADREPLSRALAGTLARFNPGIWVRRVMPLEEVGAEDRAVFAGIGAALSMLGAIALLLSVISVYAMLSFSVTQRTREIAIRSALGATRLQVLWPVLARASAPLVIGTLAGFPLSRVLVAARGIFAFRLPDGSGPWGVPVLALLMIVPGLAASWLPVRRALNISPSEAIRAE